MALIKPQRNIDDVVETSSVQFSKLFWRKLDPSVTRRFLLLFLFANLEKIIPIIYGDIRYTVLEDVDIYQFLITKASAKEKTMRVLKRNLLKAMEAE